MSRETTGCYDAGGSAPSTGRRASEFEAATLKTWESPT